MNGEMAPGCEAQGSPMRFLPKREFFNWKSEGCLSNEVDIVLIKQGTVKKKKKGKKGLGKKTHPFLQNTEKAQLELPHILWSVLFVVCWHRNPRRSVSPTDVALAHPACASSRGGWVMLLLETASSSVLTKPCDSRGPCAGAVKPRNWATPTRTECVGGAEAQVLPRVPCVLCVQRTAYEMSSEGHFLLRNSQTLSLTTDSNTRC